MGKNSGTEIRKPNLINRGRKEIPHFPCGKFGLGPAFPPGRSVIVLYTMF